MIEQVLLGRALKAEGFKAGAIQKPIADLRASRAHRNLDCVDLLSIGCLRDWASIA